MAELSRYLLVFPMRDEPDRRLVVTAASASLLFETWSDLVESRAVPPGLSVYVRTLDIFDPRPPEPIRPALYALAGIRMAGIKLGDS